MVTWRTLHPRWISHAPGVISIHGGFLPGKPRACTLRFGAESLPIEQPQLQSTNGKPFEIQTRSSRSGTAVLRQLVAWLMHLAETEI